jgi:RNA polymerase sigma-70 factor, ECF subfamily
VSLLPPRPRVIQGWFPASSGPSSSGPGADEPPAGGPPPAGPPPDAPIDLGSTLDLVQRAREGDQTAWEMLVARYQGPLKRFARTRLARQAHRLTDTDDVVQDVTVSVFRRLHRIELRFPGALLAYLRRSVSNRVADEHRRAVRQGPIATLADDYPDAQQSPLDLTIDKDKVRVYRAALLTLSADDRAAVVMRLERGATYEAIAARLSKPTPNAARVAVARAMFKLAKAMAPLTPKPPVEPIAAPPRQVKAAEAAGEPPQAAAAGQRRPR